MSRLVQDTRRYRAGLFLLCVLCLAAIYLMTYSARIESGDSLRLFDSVTSLVRFGDSGRDESIWFTPPVLLNTDALYPLADYERGTELTTGLVSILYRIADVLPGIGFVHTGWLLNILLTALAGGVFFWLVLASGYDERTAVLATLVSGTGTIILPYTKTLFREPQTMLMLTLCLLWVMYWRQTGGWQRWLWLAGGTGAFILACLFKESALMAAPALLIWLLPGPASPRYARIVSRLSDIALILLIVLVILVTYSEPLFNGLLQLAQPLLSRMGWNTTFTRVALHTYLFSIGGSLIGTSPVLLLAVPGCVWLIRRNQRRTAWFIVLAVIGYAAGHALLTGVHWFGGLSWPSRFMLPVIPYVMMGTLPVLERVITPAIPRIQAEKDSLPVQMEKETGDRVKAMRPPTLKIPWRIPGFVVLMAYSLWVNFNAVALPWWHYQALLPPDVPFEWSDGLNRIEYLRWVIQPQSWAALGFDFAWARAGIPGWIAAFAGFGGGMLAGIMLTLRRGRAWRWPMPGLIGAVFILLLLVYGGLRQLYATDTLYRQNAALEQVMDVLEVESRPGDVLLLTDNVYNNFFFNNNRLTLRVITLPFPPGERASPDEPPRVVSHNPADLLVSNSTYIIPALLDHFSIKWQRVWVLANYGPFTPWAVRPVERYLSQRHYVLRVFDTPDPTVRLLEYSLIRAPDPYDFVSPEILTDLRYGESIALQGYTLPERKLYQPGDVLAVSFAWLTDTALSTDYVVAWFVARADGSAPLLQGRDTPPYDGFAPTSTWQPGIPVWDNHALRLPPDLPSGEYRLWVVLYQFMPDGSLERLPVSGAEAINGTIGVLPGVIKVMAGS